MGATSQRRSGRSTRRSCNSSVVLFLLAYWAKGSFTEAADGVRPGAADGVTTVHVIFSNHLDIGFGGVLPAMGFDDVVINKYFHVHFPKAISLAQEFNARFAPQRFIFTTHAYIISLFLDCPPGMGLRCPNKEAVHNLTKAIRRGDITWHAYPFNAELEVADPSLIEFAVDMVHELDEKFGQPIKTTLSQRDVPGLTRAALPILVKKGIKAISVGVNGGSAPPGVPKNTPFIWQDPISGARVLATWHPGGYGGSFRADCVQANNFSHVLCPAWREDNQGPPPGVWHIEMTLNLFRIQFPGAEVRASTFEDYLHSLEEAAPDLDLPVVTGEIGDTWVIGVQSDPLKMATYRTAQRLRTWCLEQQICSLKDPAFRNFSRLLLKVHEHTWGVDVFQALHDFANYTNAALQKALKEKRQNYMDCVWAWKRQALYVQWAVEALPHQHPIAQRFYEELDAMNEAKHAHKRYGANAKRHSLTDGPLTFHSNSWAIEIDTKKGSISRLQRLWGDDKRPGVNWAGGEGSSFGRLLYSTYDEASYDVVWNTCEYNPRAGWFESSFGKVNCSLGNPRRAEIHPRLTEALSTVELDSGALVILLHYTFPDWAVREAGAPESMWTIIHMHDSQPPPSRHPRSHAPPDAVHIDVLWVNKTATRLPEALWLQFKPGSGAVDPDSWTMNKLGQDIRPGEVILNGSMSQHAIQDEAVKVLSADASEQLTIGSLDASLVSPGVPTVMPNVLDPPDMTNGMSFNLVNSVWGTNYIMWIPYTKEDANMAFRFFLTANQPATPY